MEPLTDSRQEAFAQALAQGRDPTRAAIDAGYAPRAAGATGRRLAARPEVAARAEALRGAAPAAPSDPAPPAAAAGLPTRETVLRGLSDALTEARGQGNIMAQLRALELMGKELGMFGQRSDAKPDNPLAGFDAPSLLALRDLLMEEGAR